LSQFDVDVNQVIDSIGNVKWKSIQTRNKPWLHQEVFNKYRSETNMMRYIYELVSKDFSLVNGMMPLGSCTMKLNAASELILIYNQMLVLKESMLVYWQYKNIIGVVVMRKEMYV